jgi:streptogramin lyase
LREFPLSSPQGQPHALAVDRHGNIWVGERMGNCIDEVTPHGSWARLAEWRLPHAGSHPEGIAVSPDGTVWITESANRIAWLDPQTNRMQEYATPRKTGPHGIQVATSGPVFVNERGDSATWVQRGAHQIVQFKRFRLPTQRAQPSELVVMAHGVIATEYGGGALIWLDGNAGQVHRVHPDRYKLSMRITRTVAVQSGLPTYRYHLTPRAYTVGVRHGRHWTEWRLPHPKSQPYDLRVTSSGKRVWLTEDRANAVGLLLPTSKRVLEYLLPQKHSRPKGLELRELTNQTQVWLALYGIDRLGVLTIH